MNKAASLQQAGTDLHRTVENDRNNRRRRKKQPGTEFSRIRSRVRSQIARIRREETLLDAYKGEGWKGASREKPRPEKELRRARSQILHSKLAIREVLHELDIISREGALGTVAEDGSILAEEIFCAKCKSGEATPKNDILLCDGECNRAFHQRCLSPPLKSEDIPPEEEGWLCPACDCKVDCIGWINTNFGTTLSSSSSWKEIFPKESKLAEDGETLVVCQSEDEWPSDESDDSDFDPEGQRQHNLDFPVEGGGDSDSDVSVSDEEDESDTSDAEADVSLDELRREGGVILEGSRTRGGTHSTSEHQEDIQEPGSLILTGKRKRTPVDYQKLNDELFGTGEAFENETLDDKEWDEPIGRGPRRRRRAEQKQASDAGTSAEGAVEGAASSHKMALSPGVFNTLNNAFLEEPVPSKATKAALAEQLNMSLDQVNRWFRNARARAQLKRRKEVKQGEGRAPAAGRAGPSLALTPGGATTRDPVVAISKPAKVHELDRAVSGRDEAVQGGEGAIRSQDRGVHGGVEAGDRVSRGGTGAGDGGYGAAHDRDGGDRAVGGGDGAVSFSVGAVRSAHGTARTDASAEELSTPSSQLPEDQSSRDIDNVPSLDPDACGGSGSSEDAGGTAAVNGSGTGSVPMALDAAMLAVCGTEQGEGQGAATPLHSGILGSPRDKAVVVHHAARGKAIDAPQLEAASRQSIARVCAPGLILEAVAQVPEQVSARLSRHKKGGTKRSGKEARRWRHLLEPLRSPVRTRLQSCSPVNRIRTRSARGGSHARSPRLSPHGMTSELPSAKRAQLAIQQMMTGSVKQERRNFASVQPSQPTGLLRKSKASKKLLRASKQHARCFALKREGTVAPGRGDHLALLPVMQAAGSRAMLSDGVGQVGPNPVPKNPGAQAVLSAFRRRKEREQSERCGGNAADGKDQGEGPGPCAGQGPDEEGNVEHGGATVPHDHDQKAECPEPQLTDTRPLSLHGKRIGRPPRFVAEQLEKERNRKLSKQEILALDTRPLSQYGKRVGRPPRRVLEALKRAGLSFQPDPRPVRFSKNGLRIGRPPKGAPPRPPPPPPRLSVHGKRIGRPPGSHKLAKAEEGAALALDVLAGGIGLLLRPKSEEVPRQATLSIHGKRIGRPPGSGSKQRALGLGALSNAALLELDLGSPALRRKLKRRGQDAHSNRPLQDGIKVPKPEQVVHGKGTQGAAKMAKKRHVVIGLGAQDRGARVGCMVRKQVGEDDGAGDSVLAPPPPPLLMLPLFKRPRTHKVMSPRPPCDGGFISLIGAHGEGMCRAPAELTSADVASSEAGGMVPCAPGGQQRCCVLDLQRSSPQPHDEQVLAPALKPVPLVAAAEDSLEAADTGHNVGESEASVGSGRLHRYGQTMERNEQMSQAAELDTVTAACCVTRRPRSKPVKGRLAVHKGGSPRAEGRRQEVRATQQPKRAVGCQTRVLQSQPLHVLAPHERLWTGMAEPEQVYERGDCGVAGYALVVPEGPKAGVGAAGGGAPGCASGRGIGGGSIQWAADIELDNGGLSESEGHNAQDRTSPGHAEPCSDQYTTGGDGGVVVPRREAMAGYGTEDVSGCKPCVVACTGIALGELDKNAATGEGIALEVQGTRPTNNDTVTAQPDGTAEELSMRGADNVASLVIWNCDDVISGDRQGSDVGAVAAAEGMTGPVEAGMGLAEIAAASPGPVTLAKGGADTYLQAESVICSGNSLSTGKPATESRRVLQALQERCISNVGGSAPHGKQGQGRGPPWLGCGMTGGVRGAACYGAGKDKVVERDVPEEEPHDFMAELAALAMAGLPSPIVAAKRVRMEAETSTARAGLCFGKGCADGYLPALEGGIPSGDRGGNDGPTVEEVGLMLSVLMAGQAAGMETVLNAAPASPRCMWDSGPGWTKREAPPAKLSCHNTLSAYCKNVTASRVAVVSQLLPLVARPARRLASKKEKLHL